MSSHHDAEPSRRPRKRRFQFGLSTLLVVVLAAGILLAWQRERLSRWIESLRISPPATPAKDVRDAKQVVLDFLDHKRRGSHADADKLLSEKAREVTGRLMLGIVEIPPDGS